MRKMMRISVTTIGSRAQRAVAAGRQWNVIARFDRSVYIENTDSHIVCLGGQQMMPGPINALISDFDSVRFRCGDAVSLDVTHASLWRPRGVYSNQADLPRGIRHLKNVMRTSFRPRGLAADDAPDPFIVRGRQGLDALTDWIGDAVCGTVRSVPFPVEQLIGLGYGLTPSGDDALGGALIALRAFGHATEAAALARVVLPVAVERTNRISFAHLAAAAEGEGVEALHDVLVGVAWGDEKKLECAVARMDAMGHTSGWDALAGILATVP